MKDKKKVATQSRHTCYRCKTKRYENKMVRIFDHPILTGRNPIWACKFTTRIYNVHDCATEVIKDIVMYHETGMLEVVVKKK